VSRTSVDESTNTTLPPAAAPDPVIDYYDAEGGAVTTSENKKYLLMSLLKAFDRDVFYAMKDISAWTKLVVLVLHTPAQKFPD
jgi:hypothetical protein